MSLLKEFATPCVIMNKITASDGQGGLTTEWQEGAEIEVAITVDNSIATKIGEREGVATTYRLTTHKSVVLDFHDVIKRLKDGKTFRVTSDHGDEIAPTASSLDMSVVKAEKWELTT